MLLGVLLILYRLEGGSSQVPKWIAKPQPRVLWETLRNTVGLQWYGNSHAWMALTSVTLLGLLGLGMLHLLRQPAPRGQLSRPWMVLLVGLLATLPPLALYALSFWWLPVWVVRYLTPSTACLLLLLALCASALHPRWLGGILAAVVLAGSFTGSVVYHFDPAYQRPNWRGVATYVIGHMQPGDGLAVYRPFEKLTIDFFLGDTSLETIPLSIKEPENVVAMHERMRSLLAEHDRVWVVWLEEHQQSSPTGWIEEALPDAVQLDYVDFAKLNLYLYRGGEP
jgi:hypothetical protein